VLASDTPVMAEPLILTFPAVTDDVAFAVINVWVLENEFTSLSSTTLSGWESQRVKLATELSKRSTSKTFYILDEPTTWLHFQDVDKLLTILHSLVDKWNTVMVIEHNMDVIMNADHIIDIWPVWWDKWWYLIAQWNVEDIANEKNSYTWEAIIKYRNKLIENK
jgi:excinuclease ABC subunit A